MIPGFKVAYNEPKAVGFKVAYNEPKAVDNKKKRLE